MGDGNDTLMVPGSLAAYDIQLKGQDGLDTIIAVDNLFASNELEIKQFEIIT